MKQIKVTGKGELSVAPTITEVILTIEGLEDEYYQALSKSADETNEIKAILLENGLKKEAVRTKSFDVRTKTKSVKDQYGNYHDKFLGYEYYHNISFKFKNDNELLGKILYSISKTKVNPEIRVKYLVENVEEAKNKILANAVKDSMSKASIIASAANVELADIDSIDYSWGTISFESDDYMLMNKYSTGLVECRSSGFDIDINPEDIAMNDTVTVVWNIK
jgi:uncharacterized protein YggE